jgi:two-component system, NtrC family, response regulator AtoC
MEPTKKVRILVVEDDNLFRWTLNHFLTKEGYEVYPVATGESAADMAQELSFDILISDFHLPGLNGKELIREVKATQPQTKTILISAYQPEELGNEDGTLLNGYLNKPIELGVLKQLLQDLTKPMMELAPGRST